MSENNFDIVAREDGLNRSQKKFCKLPPKKNVRLLAPAGAGKTFSLLWRCKYLTEQAIINDQSKPHFLIVTFTRAAKNELEYRINHNDAFEGINATIKTLNAWGWDQIKKPGKELLVTSAHRQMVVTHDLLPICNKHERISNALRSSHDRRKNATKKGILSMRLM